MTVETSTDFIAYNIVSFILADQTDPESVKLVDSVLKAQERRVFAALKAVDINGDFEAGIEAVTQERSTLIALRSIAGRQVTPDTSGLELVEAIAATRSDDSTTVDNYIDSEGTIFVDVGEAPRVKRQYTRRTAVVSTVDNDMPKEVAAYIEGATDSLSRLD